VGGDDLTFEGVALFASRATVFFLAGAPTAAGGCQGRQVELLPGAPTAAEYSRLGPDGGQACCLFTPTAVLRRLGRDLLKFNADRFPSLGGGPLLFAALSFASRLLPFSKKIESRDIFWAKLANVECDFSLDASLEQACAIHDLPKFAVAAISAPKV